MNLFRLFFLIIAFFGVISFAQAADTIPFPTEAQIEQVRGSLSPDQYKILMAATRLHIAHPELTPAQILLELTEVMGYATGANARNFADITAGIYADAFRVFTLEQTRRTMPRPNTITAPPIFPDSAARIQEYLRAFGASSDPAIRADIARLRMIYDPATSGVFTPRERQVAELRILSRDPQTLTVPTSEELAAWARNRYPDLTAWARNRYPSRDIWGNPYYPTSITRTMIDTHWPRFMRHEESLPTIQAQQNAMRQLILANTSLSPTERAFALAALTTSRDGNPPSIRSLLPLPAFNGQITRPAAYELIRQIQAQQIPSVITSPGPTLTTPILIAPPAPTNLPPPTLPGTGR